MSIERPAPLTMQRNEDLQQVWTITDGVPTAEHPHGAPLDITSYSFAAKIRPGAGSATLTLALPQNASTVASGFHREAPYTDGQVTLTVRHADMAAVALPNAQGMVELAYDVLMTDTDTGTVTCIAAGPFIYQPAVT